MITTEDKRRPHSVTFNTSSTSDLITLVERGHGETQMVVSDASGTWFTEDDFEQFVQFVRTWHTARRLQK